MCLFLVNSKKFQQDDILVQYRVIEKDGRDLKPL
jgi:hypothetical protein